MNTILVQYDPFVMESRVFLIKDGAIHEGKVASNLETLASELVAYAYGNNAFYVKLAAPAGVYDEMVRQITTIEANTYSENKIILEKE